MWTRVELKQQAREALQRNYWKNVLVALLLMALGGNWIGNVFSSASGGATTANVEEQMPTDEGDEGADLNYNRSDYSVLTIIEATNDLSETVIDETVPDMPDMNRRNKIVSGIIVFIVLFIIFLFGMAAVLAFEIFLGFPVIVGAGRFMLKSVDGRAEVREVAYAFDHSYKNVVKTMFHTQLSIFLWSMLLVIPGIYKQYQYRMVEYILAEHPDMYYKEAMQLSRNMMEGEKWNAFVLDLSFILWKVGSIITCGMLYVLFVAPYQYLTNAALYRKLCTKEEFIYQ